MGAPAVGGYLVGEKTWNCKEKRKALLMCHAGRDQECKALKSSPISQRLTD